MPRGKKELPGIDIHSLCSAVDWLSFLGSSGSDSLFRLGLNRDGPATGDHVDEPCLGLT